MPDCVTAKRQRKHFAFLLACVCVHACACMHVCNKTNVFNGNNPFKKNFYVILNVHNCVEAVIDISWFHLHYHCFLMKFSYSGDFHSSGGMLESPSSPEQFSDPPDFSPDVEIVPETNVKPKDLECNSGQSGSSESKLNDYQIRLFKIHIIYNIKKYSDAEVGAIGITCSSDVDVESTPHTFHPAVVEGVDAVQAALKEGMFPVLDKTVDVFAVPSAPGLNILFCTICTLLYIHGSYYYSKVVIIYKGCAQYVLMKQWLPNSVCELIEGEIEGAVLHN